MYGCGVATVGYGVHAGVGYGGSWWGIGAVVIGTLILIALLAVFVTMF